VSGLGFWIFAEKVIPLVSQKGKEEARKDIVYLIDEQGLSKVSSKTHFVP